MEFITGGGCLDTVFHMSFFFDSKKIFHVYHNTLGLKNDSEMIIEALGDSAVHHTFVWEHYDPPSKLKNNNIRPEDEAIVIFYEHLLDVAVPNKKVIMIPNPDWFMEEDLNLAGQVVDEFWHKTKFSLARFSREFPSKKHYYIGWTSKDLHLPEVKTDYNRFFLQMGAARRRQLDVVLECWMRNPHFPPLTITAYDKTGILQFPFPLNWKNVTLHLRQLTKHELEVEMNRNGVHLCLGTTEGFGHYINEARSVEALAMVMDGPPMNELINTEFGMLIPHSEKEEFYFYDKFFASPRNLQVVINHVLALREEERQQMGRHARRIFLQEKRDFFRRIKTLMLS